MNYYLQAFRQYASFRGRTTRTAYWMFILFNTLFAFLALFLDYKFKIRIEDLPYGFIYVLYVLVTFLPNLAITVRRLHDVGKSGWMYFVSLIPFVGSIWLLILLTKEGNTETNEYGNPPNEIHFLDKINADTTILRAIICRVAASIVPIVLFKIALSVYSEIYSIFHIITIVALVSIIFTIRKESLRIPLIIIGSMLLSNSIANALILAEEVLSITYRGASHWIILIMTIIVGVIFSIIGVQIGRKKDDTNESLSPSFEGEILDENIFQEHNSPSTTSVTNRDRIIAVVIVIEFALLLFEKAFRIYLDINDLSFLSTSSYVYYMIMSTGGIISVITFLALAFFIKDEAKRRIGIILGSIYVLVHTILFFVNL